MSDRDSREFISAMLDGELDADQLRFALRRMQHEPELNQDWERHHLLRDAMQGELSALAATGFADGVMQRIHATIEPASAQPIDTEKSSVGTRSRRHRWWRWSAGGAVAASVAIAALIVMRPDVATTPAPAEYASAEMHDAPTADERITNQTEAPVEIAAAAISSDQATQWLQPLPQQPPGPTAQPAAAGYSLVPDWRGGGAAMYRTQRMRPMSPAHFDIGAAANQAVIESSSNDYKQAVEANQ